ncbi:MAG: UDP-N-acetylmuramoyl-tripeptide--D-alanyl-D-alanine ligase [Thermodesulfobacteriota bacterium]
MFEQEFILKSTTCELITSKTISNFNGISIDSRRIMPGDLYIAIKGENFDGHDFINEAFEKGANGVILEYIPADLNLNREKTVIKVSSTVEALGNIANAWRNRFEKLKVVCITGSNGKTTTKEITASILSVKKKVLKNSGNFNNHVGLPLTLLKLDDNFDICVAEIGMNDFGEIRYLTDIAEPDVGVITNIGRAHLEKLQTLEGVAKAKGELVEKFGKNNCFIVNMDDPYISDIASDLDCKKVCYSLENKGFDIYAENLKNNGLESISFTLVINNETVNTRIRGIGTHNVMNALCASGIAYSLGYSRDEIREGIERYSPIYMRLEIIETPQGFKIINDSYNANPDSMSNALKELSKLKNDNNLIAVLGDMLELGSSSSDEHRKIGEYIKNLNIDFVITYGNDSKYINKEVEGNIDNIHVETHQEAAKYLIEKAKDKDFVLLKGSRGMKMENTIKFLY